MLKNIIISFLILSSIIVAQKKGDKYLLFKAGIAKSSIGSFNFGGSGDAYSYWKTGPHIALGAGYYLSRVSSLQLIGEYSIFTFDKPSYVSGQLVNDPKNIIVDLMGSLKLNIGPGYILGGLGYSYQHGEEVFYKAVQNTNMGNISPFYPEKSKFLFAGVLGVGLDIHLIDNISLLFEGNLRMREYTGTSVMAGIKYSLQ